MCVYPISLRNISPFPPLPLLLQSMACSCSVLYMPEKSQRTSALGQPHTSSESGRTFLPIFRQRWMARGFIHRIFSYFSLSLLASLSLSLHVYGCASDTAEKMKVERKHSKQYKRQKKIGKKWRGFQIIKQKYAQQRRMYKKRQITRSCTSEKNKEMRVFCVCVFFF